MGLCFVNDLLFFRQAHLLVEHGLLLEAVLLLLVNTLLNRLIVALCPLHLVTLRPQTLLLTVIAHLTLHRLALFVVGILLGLLRLASPLQLAPLHRLAVTVLLLHWVREIISELLAVLARAWLAYILANLTWSVVAFLGWYLITFNAVLAILWLDLATLKVNRENACTIFDNKLLVPAVDVVHINTLKVILGGDGQIVHSVTHPIFSAGAPLDKVIFLNYFIVLSLHKAAHQLGHLETFPLFILFNDRGAILFMYIITLFFLLSVASLLYVWHTLVLIHKLVHVVTIFKVTRFAHFIRSIMVRLDRYILIMTSSVA